jgi:hypothetical protein
LRWPRLPALLAHGARRAATLAFGQDHGIRHFAGELLFSTMTSLGKPLSERNPGAAEIDRWTNAVSEMLTMYFAQLAPRRRST